MTRPTVIRQVMWTAALVALAAAAPAAQPTPPTPQAKPALPGARPADPVQPAARPPSPSAQPDQPTQVIRQDLRARRERSREGEFGTLVLGVSGPCTPPACTMQLNTTPLLPFPPPPNNRALLVDGGEHLLTIVNNGQTLGESISIKGGAQLTKFVTLPQPAPVSTGTISVAVEEPAQVTVGNLTREVAKESTFPVALGAHTVTIEQPSGKHQTTVTLTPESPGVRIVYAAAPAPPARPTAPVGGEVRWAAVSGGSIEMGCVMGDRACEPDEKVRTAAVAPFEIMTTEVTVGQFENWLKQQPSTESDYARPQWSASIPVAELAMHPAVRVTWSEATAFCAAQQARLPTEAEWEAAARQGRRGRVYAWDPEAGDPDVFGPPAAVTQSGPRQPGPAGDITGRRQPGNFADEAAGRRFSTWTVIRSYDDGYSFTAPVGSYRPVGGLYDLTGNVWEWTQDAYDDRSGRAPDLSLKVLRGGSWTSEPPVTLRISHRLTSEPNKRADDFGFRCAK